MGWANGSGICGNVLNKILPELEKHNVSKKATINLVSDIIEIFENEDCDTTDELYGENEIINKALEKLHPDYLEEE